MRGWRWVASVYVALVVHAGIAGAHEVGGTRFAAPVPLPVIYVGAGLTVALTAGWLALIGDYREWHMELWRVDRSAATIGGAVLRWGFFLAFLFVLVAGLFGVGTPTENPATLFVWPVWLKGLVVISAVVGSPWRLLSPWRTLYAVLVRLEGQKIAVLDSYPQWLGTWPAVGGFIVWLGIIENLSAVPTSPRLTAGMVAGYAGYMLIGAVMFGPRWFHHADTLAVLYRLVGRVAPIQIHRVQGPITVTVRPPWQGCTTRVSFASAFFIGGLVYTVSFDGFTSTPEYQTLTILTQRAIGPVADIALYCVGLAIFLIVLFAVTGRLEFGSPWQVGITSYVPTVLPIAVGYEIAHNYPFIIQSLGQLVSTTMGVGAFSDPLWWLSLPGFWASQVCLVVAGHVFAVAAAHGVASTRLAARRRILRAHGLLTVLMVAYTMLSLWIISRPIVT